MPIELTSKQKIALEEAMRETEVVSQDMQHLCSIVSKSLLPPGWRCVFVSGRVSEKLDVSSLHVAVTCKSDVEEMQVVDAQLATKDAIKMLKMAIKSLKYAAERPLTREELNKCH